MNTYHHITDQAELEQLIERYFNGETTVQEEQSLREVLADCPWSSETIDEARFTLGYYSVHKQQQRRATTVANRFRFVAAAASVALILTVGIATLWHSQQPENLCIAYVNGEVIENNQKAIMSLIAQDLNDMDMATREIAGAIADDMSEMNEASRLMTDELSSLGDAIELDD